MWKQYWVDMLAQGFSQAGKGWLAGPCHRHHVGTTKCSHRAPVLAVAWPGQACRWRDRGAVCTHSAGVMRGVSQAKSRQWKLNELASRR
jgi:hypothetical protein